MDRTEQNENIDPIWNFPIALGPVHGFKDAGTATYSGKIMPSFVREICQNSLDAAVCAEDPVRVEFEKYEILPEQIPGFSSFVQAVEYAASYWDSSKSEEIAEHLRRMNHVLMQPDPLPILRASDYKTTGLRGAYEDRFDDWSWLTKMDGGATKGGVSAGSYGIGKNAPFAASGLRMVFYRTLTDEKTCNGRAAQGIVHLPPYPRNRTEERSTQILGIGYYGDPAAKTKLPDQPVPFIALLDELHNRTEIGTDIFTFDFPREKDWMTAVAIEVLENFLLAISYGKLEVSITDGKTKWELTRESLPHMTERLEKKQGAKNAISYFQILARPDQTETYTQDFHGLGTLSLRLLSDTEQKLNRKVLVSRMNHMKILAIDRISGNLNFTGILELQGEALNKYFRALETPAHDKWEADRYTANPKEAGSYIAELRRWVKETVQNAAAMTTSEKMHIEGVSSNLRVKNSGSGEKTEKEDSSGEITSQIKIEIDDEPHGPGSTETGKISVSGAEPDNNGSVGVIDGGGSHAFPRTQIKRMHKKLGGDGSGSSQIRRGRPGGKQPQVVKLHYVRLVPLDEFKVRLILQADQDIPKGTIKLHIVGENGKQDDHLRIRELLSASGITEIHAGHDHIRFNNLPGRQKIVMDIELENRTGYAMGVAVYEDR